MNGAIDQILHQASKAMNIPKQTAGTYWKCTMKPTPSQDNLNYSSNTLRTVFSLLGYLTRDHLRPLALRSSESMEQYIATSLTPPLCS